MQTFEADPLQQALELARQLVARLEPISADIPGADPLALRLAQAHALGLVDQLAEIARAHVVAAPRPRPSIPVIATGPFDDELLDG